MIISNELSVEELGGKAYHLSILEEEVNIPDFFVLSINNINELNDERVINEIFDCFDRKNFNIVSVRSSANLEDSKYNSFAGLFKTKLNVTKEKLIDSIKDVFLSATDNKIKQYCKFYNLNYRNLKMRIIIQKMVDSRISGVCFSRINNNSNLMMIEACYGLGEVLVDGIITPDSFQVDRETLTLSNSYVHAQKKQKILGNDNYVDVDLKSQVKPKMTSEELKQLCNEVLKIEKILNNNAIDIEWAFEKDVLFILQIRPITTFNKY